MEDEPKPEDIIDTLIKNQSDYGYMAKHNKILQVRPLPKTVQNLDDLFYKGSFWKGDY